MAFIFSRSFLFVLGINILFFIWVLLDFNHREGIHFRAVETLTLMLLLPIAIIGNAGLWSIAFGFNKRLLTKAFGYLLLLLMSGCTAVWVHGCATGVTI
ncbi:hypothetical protein MON38_04420 [Hymenobacter sp. DH14]|uniref:Uncharacterized protein n=1 Tax=Hymenobacter cyanobacteriorum TaxID=2926463 RepID=A0A9X2ADX8_9BACT|nr:hypothetical protein [Hymenobacter cyanobacteriorum]MCI1186651.1 hypothetical protein [Hymenobacter cyanobacteriorum]